MKTHTDFEGNLFNYGNAAGTAPKAELEITVCTGRSYRSAVCEQAVAEIENAVKERGMQEAVIISYADFSDKFHEPAIIIGEKVLRGKEILMAAPLVNAMLDAIIYNAMRLAKKDYINLRYS